MSHISWAFKIISEDKHSSWHPYSAGYSVLYLEIVLLIICPQRILFGTLKGVCGINLGY